MGEPHRFSDGNHTKGKLYLAFFTARKEETDHQLSRNLPKRLKEKTCKGKYPKKN